MGVKELLGVLFALLIILAAAFVILAIICFCDTGKSSFREQAPKIEQAKPQVYVVEEPHSKTYIVEGKKCSSFDVRGRHDLNIRRYNQERQEEDEEFDKRSKYKRVVRSSDGKTVYGYLEKVDDPGFKKVDS